MPQGKLANWLVYPGRDTPLAIRTALVSTLFGTLPIFLGGVFNTIAVAAALAYRHPSPLFLIWLFSEAAVCLARLVVLVISHRRAQQGKPTPTDLYILLAPLWGATVGYGALISATSGDWVAATLSFLSAAAMVGGICFRNFAAPRLVAIMIFLSLGPCCIGAVLSGEPVLLLTHNPDVFPMVPDRVALTIAGHTHGGQVRLPWIGAPIVPSRFGQRFAAGHVVEGNRHLFVATGVGTSIIPVRFRVPPAVTILRLESDRPHDAKAIR